MSDERKKPAKSTRKSTPREAAETRYDGAEIEEARRSRRTKRAEVETARREEETKRAERRAFRESVKRAMRKKDDEGKGKKKVRRGKRKRNVLARLSLETAEAAPKSPKASGAAEP